MNIILSSNKFTSITITISKEPKKYLLLINIFVFVIHSNGKSFFDIVFQYNFCYIIIFFQAKTIMLIKN